MGLQFSTGGANIAFGVGSAAQLGNGAFTLLSLYKVSGNAGLLGGFNTGLERQAYGIDTLHLFGTGDFSSGFGNLVSGDWYWLGMSKPAGPNHYRGHIRDYSTAGAWSHGEAVGAGNHGDPGTSNELRVGANSSFGSATGVVAVSAVFTSVLTDPAIEAACTSLLSDLMLAAPQWAAKFNVGATTAPIQDLTAGGGNETGRSGTITEVADPPGFNFGLGPAPATLFLPFFGR